MSKYSNLIILSLALTGITMSSCRSRLPKEEPVKVEQEAILSDTIVTTVIEREDSCIAGTVSLYMELPSGTDAVSTTIADTLLKIIDNNVAYMGVGGDTRLIPPYEGERDFNKIANYYDKSVILYYEKQREEMLKSMIGEAQKNSEIFDVKYAYEMKVEKCRETGKLAVFLSKDYWYLGGVHGGISGAGYLTFNKKTGKMFKNFLKSDVKEMQELLRHGLIEYFNEASEHVNDSSLYALLMIDNDSIIPLPVQALCPTERGMLFTYNQYEIAPYAAGMPSFIIRWRDILPHLTKEAKELLELE